MTQYTWTPEDPEFNPVKQKLLEYYKIMNYAKTQRCINAFERVPRSLYIPPNQKKNAYNDSPLPIGFGQTISAPHMAFMECDALDIQPGDNVLEIGSGSGYHASICAEICAPSDIIPANWKPLTSHYDDSIYHMSKGRKGHVYSIERIEELVAFARSNIKNSGYEDRVTIIQSDGTMGYEREAPYDVILVTAAGPKVPVALKEQLRVGGRMVIPVGAKNFHQDLKLVERVGLNTWNTRNIGGVVFVPLIGKFGFKN